MLLEAIGVMKKVFEQDLNTRDRVVLTDREKEILKLYLYSVLFGKLFDNTSPVRNELIRDVIPVCFIPADKVNPDSTLGKPHFSMRDINLICPDGVTIDQFQFVYKIVQYTRNGIAHGEFFVADDNSAVRVCNSFTQFSIDYDPNCIIDVCDIICGDEKVQLENQESNLLFDINNFERVLSSIDRGEFLSLDNDENRLVYLDMLTIMLTAMRGIDARNFPEVLSDDIEFINHLRNSIIHSYRRVNNGIVTVLDYNHHGRLTYGPTEVEFDTIMDLFNSVLIPSLAQSCELKDENKKMEL